MRGIGKNLGAIVGTLILLLLSPAATGRAAAGAQDKVDASRIRDTLRDALQTAQAGQTLSVVIVMREQARADRIAELRAIADKTVRRAAIIELLKNTASRSQTDLLEVLRAGQAVGTVGESIRPLWLSNVIVADLTPAMIRRLALRDDINYLHLESRLGEEVFPVEPVKEDSQVESGVPLDGPVIECGVELMGAPRVWNELGITGRGTVVCVIDTGCCITHPDLINQIWVNTGEIPGNGIDDDNNGYIDDVNGWNFWQRNGDLTDTSGHGTHVSGTVAGDGTNGQQTGMAPDTRLMTCRYFVSFAGESTIWESMQYAVDNGADIITVSSGWPHSQNPDRPTWRAECDNAMAAGLAVLYAAGNEGSGTPPPDQVRTPGDVPDVITVGAVDCNDNLAGFSSKGPVTWQNIPPYNDWPYPPGKLKPTISGPGVNTLSTQNSGCSTYHRLSGTSMATPHIAGAVALMLEANPDLDHFQIKQILKDTAVDLGAPGPDNSYGAGRVDAFAAVIRAIELGVSSEGQIELDSALYPCEDEVSVIVRDLDLNLDPNTVETVDITIESDSEPAGEIITLTETGSDTSRFEALVPISETNAPGTLLVADSDTIVATYNDDDNGQGQPAIVTAEATVDCAPPQITNVRVIDVQARSATIAFDSNEPVFGIAAYGLDCNALNNSASGRGFTTTPTVEITGLRDNTTYFFTMEAEDEAGNRAADPVCYSFTTPEVPDFFTEQFLSGFDLQNLSLSFTPDGGNDFYVGCAEEIAVLPTPSAGGTLLPLTDDSFLQVTPPQPVSIYGTSYNSFFVGSNGYITFGAGDRDFGESLADHFDLPRISGAFDDLNPAAGGRVSWKDVGDRVAVTWRNVPEFSNTGANTFQIEIFYADGTIRVSYLSLTLQDAIAGLSEGNGRDPDFFPTDLSEMGSCGLLGDLNCDGVIDALDIEPFLVALFDPGQYPVLYPNCDINLGDINGDGRVDADDINGFLGLLFP